MRLFRQGRHDWLQVASIQRLVLTRDDNDSEDDEENYAEREHDDDDNEGHDQDDDNNGDDDEDDEEQEAGWGWQCRMHPLAAAQIDPLGFSPLSSAFLS